MPNSPLAFAAKYAGLFGLNDAQDVASNALRANAAARQAGKRVERSASALTTGGRRASRSAVPSGGRNVPGIPGLTENGRNRMGPGAGAKAGTGATRTVQRPRQQAYADVVGMPSLSMLELADHSVEILINLNSRYTEFMDDGDLAELARTAAMMEREERRLSRGRLTYAKLAKMNHPYGRGSHAPGIRTRKDKRGRTIVLSRKRKALPATLAPKKYRDQGLTAWNVVNRHTGNFERAWTSSAQMRFMGAQLRIANTETYSAALAFGTKRMKPHGPFTAVPALYRSRINQQWLQMSRRAWQRQQSQRGVQ